MADKTLKAYAVHEPHEGHGCIVFATNSATARRMGASNLDIEWDGVDTCRRVQWADQYSPGPVPPLAMVEQGWWFHCPYCDQTVSSDSCDMDEDGNYIPHQPVADGDRVFCCPEHAGRFHAERRLRRAAEVAMVELVTTKWPGVEVHSVHLSGFQLLPRNEEGDSIASARFTFPGGKYPVEFAFGDDTVRIWKGDFPAWEAFTGKAVQEVEGAGDGK